MIYKSIRRLISILLPLSFGLFSASALTLTWDPGNTTNGGTIDPGNGTWDLSSVIWNTGTGDVAWSQTSTTSPLNNAMFGGVDGTYAVTVGGTQIAVTNITFNNSGYTLSSGTIYVTGGNNPALTVATNKTATINSVLTGPNQQTTFFAKSGATLNLGGGVNTLQSIFDGTGTVNLTAGTYTPNVLWTKNITLNQESGATVNLAAGIVVFDGYAGNAVYNVASGATLTLGAGGNLDISRGGTSGTMNSGGTVTVGTSASASLVAFGLSPGPDTGVLNVTGGTFTVASGNAGSMVLFGKDGGDTAVDSYQLNVSGGTMSTPMIQYGNGANVYSSQSSATLNVTGGILYIGSGGITNNSTHPANETNIFSGGVVGALTNWLSAMPIQLGSGGGPVTFQAADSSGVAHNITLSGVLSGVQGFIKTGGGILTLSGTNIYTGNTTVNAGTLALSGSGMINGTATNNIAIGGTFDVSAISSYIMSSNTSLVASGNGTNVGSTAATVKGGTTVSLGSQPIFLTFTPSAFNGDIAHPALYISQGTLSLNGNSFTVNNASGSALGAGTYTIIQQASGNITSSGSYSVTVMGAGLIGNSSASIQVTGGSVNLVVAKALPTFSGLTSSQTVNYGTTSISLGGSISAGSAYPPSGETITVTINGNAQNTTINDSTGDFSINYNPSTIPYSATAYPITYAYGGDVSFNSTSNNSTTLTVNQLPVQLTGTRVYDGTTTAAAAILSVANVVSGDNVTVASGNAALASANVGWESITSFGTLALGGSSAGNYTLTGASGSVGITASVLAWNPSGGPTGPSDGSGTWLTTNGWWNGITNVNGTWTGTTPSGALIGAGTPGSYTVTLGSISASNVTFNTSGYTLSGGSLSLIAGGTNLSLANNVNATINSSVNQGGTTTWIIPTNSTLTVGGGGFVGGGNFICTGGGTMSITNGSYTPNVWWLQNINGVQTGGSLLSSSTLLGYGGNTSYTIDGGSASLVASNGMIIGRNGYNGVLTLESGSASAGGVKLANDTGSVGTLNQNGGSMIVPSGNTLYINYGATSSGGSGTVNLNSGTLTTPTIQFGNSSSAYNANTFAALNVNGGTLYVGAGGMIGNTNTGGLPGNTSIVFSSGTIGATTNWSSSLPMTLTNISYGNYTYGNLSFQAGDANSNSQNIVLSGALSGPGRLVKNGAGSLTLSGTNTYTGGSSINSGTLKLGATNAIPGGATSGDVSVTSTLDLNTFSDTVNGLNGSGTIDTIAGGNPILTVGGNGDGGAFSGTIKNTAGSLSLVKNGTGTQTLSGTNSYTGTTTVNAGMLNVTTASTGAGTYSVSSNATLDVQVAGAGTSLNMAALTLAAGSELTCVYTNGNPTQPIIKVSGALTPASTVTLNLSAAAVTAGQFTLIKYGSLSGSGFAAFTLGGSSGSVSLYNNVTNNSIDVIVSTLTWDANGPTAPNPSDGSGTWLTTNDWWNGFTNVSGNWSAVNPDNAIFGSGTPGNYGITLGTVDASSIFFSTSGYTLAGGTLTLIAGGTNLSMANNVDATINSQINQGGATTWSIPAGSALTIGGGGFSANGNFIWTGSGTVSITNGNYAPGVWWLQNITNIQTGGAVVSSSSTFIGYGGNTTYTINGASASLAANGGMTIGRSSSSGILTLQSGLASAAGVKMANDGSSVGVLNQNGGAFTVPIGQTFYVNYGATSSGGNGAINLSGGMLSTPTIQFGNASSAYNANTFATLNMSGGTLYIGSGGIIANTNTGGLPGLCNIALSGGTVGAAANWSSPMAMTLSNVNGSITFQAADSNGVPNNVSLSGVLSGSGGLIKTGNGTLTLSGANTYTGSTTDSVGVLSVTTASSGGGGYGVASNATLNVQVATSGTSLTMSTLTLGSGSILDLNPNTFGNPTAPMIVVSGALTPATTVTINLAATAITNGQFTLIKYGSLGGSGFGAFALGNLAGEATLINNTNNQSIDVSVSTLTWDGTINGNWDIGTTANWKTNAYYTESGGLGPAVVFDDSSSGGNTNISLNVTVSPPGVLINSTAKSYVISGAGGINGGGYLIKEGTSMFTLSTTNNYSGQLGGYTTVILSGTLQLGDGLSHNGSVVGAINDGTLLTVANPNIQLLTNMIVGTGMLVKSGSGALTLQASNAYTGGTTINAGTLTLSALNNVSMAYTNNATLQVKATSGTSLPMSGLTFGSNPQLTLDMGYGVNISNPVINVSGNLMMNGNVTVNITNAAPVGTNLLLQYAGSRNGTGSFVAGNVPTGAMIIDNSTNKQVILVYGNTPGVVIPSLNTNEIVVAVTTPQQYGAKGDGITDDSAAFQNAMNAVYNSGGSGGGVVYIPAGNYAFYTNLNIPTGVTLHGNWQDWTRGTNGLVGTTFKVYFGAGQTNGTPFIFLNRSTALRDVNIWYPNQNATNIVGYPFTIGVDCDCVVQNVALVNSYQGIQVTAPLGVDGKHIFSTVIGTPLFMGISVDNVYDVCHTENIRFSPDVWPASGLTNAPVAGGPHAAWMRANGEGMKLLRVDGEANMNTYISGYKVGIEANASVYGVPGAQFYNGYVTNCATALLAQQMQGQSGLEFTRFTLDGDTAVSHTSTNSSSTSDATVEFEDCQIIGRTGPAVTSVGTYFASWMSFQSCTISNALQLTGAGVFNAVDCTLLGATQAVLDASITRAAFTGCTFSPTTNIINNGNASNLLMDAHQSISNTLPIVEWTNVENDYLSRMPAKTNLYLVTAYGATGNGTSDDTTAIQSALTAAANNGGGIVYLPGGKYHLTNTLDVPTGVELRGPYEMRHSMRPGAADNKAKGAILQPYGGQGTTNGPVAIALEANSGVVGLSVSYETQNTNCMPFPPMIQGRGKNIYAIGVCCANAYTHVDLDSYTCTNHLIYMVDGWTINGGVLVGNGSEGSIVDCHYNPTYWGNNVDSQSQEQTSWQPIINNYSENARKVYTLGNCTELMVKDFSIVQNTFMDCTSEGAYGPSLTGIGTMCDETVRGFIFEAAASCNISIVNPGWMAIFSNYGLSNSTVAVMSTTNFQGTARFFNSPIFGGPLWDYIVGGGDIGFDLVHMDDHSQLGSRVDGGVLHLVNMGAYITHFATNLFPVYNITYGASAGISGKTNEFIGCYTYNGCSYTNLNTNNPVLVWVDYNLASQYIVLSKVKKIQTVAPAISIEEVPPLTIQAEGPQELTLQWPESAAAANLYHATDLTPPVTWMMVTNAPTLSNGQWLVTLPIGIGPCGFYRLVPL